MIKLNSQVTDSLRFFNDTDPFALVSAYGSPLYVYNERILRNLCRELKNMCPYPQFHVHFSVKANGNPTLLKIIREEGLQVDAMSPGEIFLEEAAGFIPEDIFFVSNNISEYEMRYVLNKNILISVDSVSQLEQFAAASVDIPEANRRVAVRFNPGIGAGHHEKVITGGKETKFGVGVESIPEVKNILRRYNIKLAGINQHIGSLFLEKTQYIQSTEQIFAIARQFEDLEFIDFGGGFGIPYFKSEGQSRLDLKDMGETLADVMEKFCAEYGKPLDLIIEPGRYVTAESGLLLGTVHAIKESYGVKYIGTNIGFNILLRPVMYDAYHDIEIYRLEDVPSAKYETVTIVGNICESGDILANNRLLPEITEGDLIGVLDAGAYGHVMSSNYTCRLRPAEILLCDKGGEVQLIRKQDSLEDLLRNYII
ncbi:MAG: diaminopimelate decarboxylase [Clostridiales bacterium]|nr:diaminopimelate decarboxylase [Clostridiales bacterium]